jgi:putative pyruvate formate lyase activating enzyme
MNDCQLCPRNCGVDREKALGFCRVDKQITLARAALHLWEEPCISGQKGSGTVFFVGCNLGCVFCQNRAISRGNAGMTVDTERFREILFDLKDQGAQNINLVTPMHFTPWVVEAIEPIKDALAIPVVCNTGGYDKTQTVAHMAQVADCFLPDFKFATQESAARYCHAPDYPRVALDAIREMVRLRGKPVLDEQGMLRAGTLVRHLILPGERKDSILALDLLAEHVGAENVLLSLMSQYTPQPNAEGNLARRITEYEYRTVLEHALKRGFDGYMQDRRSADASYTPSFALEGILKKN